MTTKSAKKKIFLINRDFQFRYAGAGIAAGLIASVLTATLILYPLFAFKILTSAYFLPWPVFACMFAAVLINVAIQMLFGIMLTHRVAGPMFSMIRTIRRIGAGYWNTKVNLRAQDELQMIGRHLNELSEQLVHSGMDDLIKIEELLSEVSGLDMDQTRKEHLTNKLMILSNVIKKRISLNELRSEKND
jgi:signal transduction histidine kinase